MVAKIYKSKANGEIVARSSKSYMHRALIGAALSDGETVIENIAESEDITATVETEMLSSSTSTESATSEMTASVADTAVVDMGGDCPSE